MATLDAVEFDGIFRALGSIHGGIRHIVFFPCQCDFNSEIIVDEGGGGHRAQDVSAIRIVCKPTVCS